MQIPARNIRPSHLILHATDRKPKLIAAVVTVNGCDAIEQGAGPGARRQVLGKTPEVAVVTYEAEGPIGAAVTTRKTCKTGGIIS